MKFDSLSSVSHRIRRVHILAGLLLFFGNPAAFSGDQNPSEIRQEKIALVKSAMKAFAEEVKAGRQVGLWHVAPDREGEFYPASSLEVKPMKIITGDDLFEEVLRRSFLVVVEPNPTGSLSPLSPMRLVLYMRRPDKELEVRILTTGSETMLMSLAKDLNSAVQVAVRFQLGLRIREQSRDQNLSLITVVSPNPDPKSNLQYWLELMAVSQNEVVKTSYRNLQMAFGRGGDAYDIWNEILSIQGAVRTSCMRTLRGLEIDSF